jgi:hypothetical protein
MRMGLLDSDFVREGIVRQPAACEDGQRVPARAGTFEWWYFDFHLDDGTIVVVNFLTKPMSRVGEGIRPHVKITVTSPDGRERRVENWVGEGAFRASAETCDVVMGESTVSGDLHHYEVHAVAEDVVVDFAMDGIAPPWRPGCGKMYYGEDETSFFGWMVPVPFGRVKGRLTTGGLTREVAGTGYHDHNYGNVAMSELVESWWWSRTQLGEYTIIAVELIASAKYGGVKSPLFMLAKGDWMLTDDGSRMILHRHNAFIHPKSRKKVENRLVFDYRDDALQVALELQRKSDIYALDLLDYFPRWKAAAARLMGIRPWYLRFRGAARLDVTRNGQHEHLEGESVYELMAFGSTV